MASGPKLKLQCPICKKVVKSDGTDFPFCSDRCRIVDLGKWASGGYVVSSPASDADEFLRDTTSEDTDEE